MLTMVALILAAAQGVASSAPVQTPEQAVLEADRSFWKSFNGCDVEGMAAYVTEDLEFYHDKSGLSSGKVVFVQQTQEGMCKPGGTRLRREPIAASVRFYPIAGYGGILMGEHIFYVKEPGKAEYLDGQARFTHVWHLGDEKWQMRRVLSYDHGPPRADASPASMKLSAEILASYAGRYQSGQGLAVVTPEGNGLRIVAGELNQLPIPRAQSPFRFRGRWFFGVGKRG